MEIFALQVLVEIGINIVIGIVLLWLFGRSVERNCRLILEDLHKIRDIAKLEKDGLEIFFKTIEIKLGDLFVSNMKINAEVLQKYKQEIIDETRRTRTINKDNSNA